MASTDKLNSEPWFYQGTRLEGMSLDPSPEKKAKLQRVELPRVRDEVVWARKVDDELKKMDILNSLEDEKKLKEEFVKLPRLLTPKYDMQLTRFRFTTADPQWPLLPLMLRSGMAQLVREIKARLADPSEKSVYVTGHQGCGKSFALYAAVCFFRRGRAKYRVTYIPEWRVAHQTMGLPLWRSGGYVL